MSSFDVPGDCARFSLTRGNIRGSDASHNVTVHTLTAHKIDLCPPSAVSDLIGGAAVDNLNVFINQALGDDTNDGLTATSPVLTLNRAFDVVRRNGYNDTATIEVMSSGGPLQITQDTVVATEKGTIGRQSASIRLTGSARNEEIPVTAVTVVANPDPNDVGRRRLTVGGAPFGAAGSQRGSLITFVTGACAGESYWIQDNPDASNLDVMFERSSQVAVTDTFIVESLTSTIDIAEGVSLTFRNTNGDTLRLDDIQFAGNANNTFSLLNFIMPVVGSAIGYENNAPGFGQYQVRHFFTTAYGQIPPGISPTNLIDAINVTGYPAATAGYNVEAQGTFLVQQQGNMFGRNHTLFDQAELQCSSSASLMCEFVSFLDSVANAAVNSTMELTPSYFRYDNVALTDPMFRARGARFLLEGTVMDNNGANIEACASIEESAIGRISDASFQSNAGASNLQITDSRVSLEEIAIDGQTATAGLLVLGGASVTCEGNTLAIDNCFNQGIDINASSLTLINGCQMSVQNGTGTGVRMSEGASLRLASEPGAAHEILNNVGTGLLAQAGCRISGQGLDDLTVTGNSTGVQVSGGSSISLSDLTVSNNAAGLTLQDGSYGFFTTLTADNNTATRGVSVFTGSRLTCTTLNANSNTQNGINVTNNSNLQADSLTAGGNGGDGLRIENGSTVTTGTTLTDGGSANVDHGARVIDASKLSTRDNPPLLFGAPGQDCQVGGNGSTLWTALNGGAEAVCTDFAAGTPQYVIVRVGP